MQKAAAGALCVGQRGEIVSPVGERRDHRRGVLVLWVIRLARSRENVRVDEKPHSPRP